MIVDPSGVHDFLRYFGIAQITMRGIQYDSNAYRRTATHLPDIVLKARYGQETTARRPAIPTIQSRNSEGPNLGF
jgi:hypothetical protein